MDKPDLTNRLVTSSPCTYMIVLTEFFKLVLWQTNTQTYYKWLKVVPLNSTPVSSKEKVYPHFNQDKWVSPLANSQLRGGWGSTELAKKKKNILFGYFK